MDISTAVQLVKDSIGIRTSNSRDSFITAIVTGIVEELEDEKGLLIDLSNANHLLFVVDYATWRHEQRDSKEGLPRHLQFRMHNMMIHAKK